MMPLVARIIQIHIYDDNSRVYLDYDQDDQHSWDQHVMEYDAQKNLVNDYYLVNNSVHEMYI